MLTLVRDFMFDTRICEDVDHRKCFWQNEHEYRNVTEADGKNTVTDVMIVRQFLCQGTFTLLPQLYAISTPCIPNQTRPRL